MPSRRPELIEEVTLSTSRECFISTVGPLFSVVNSPVNDGLLVAGGGGVAFGKGAPFGTLSPFGGEKEVATAVVVTTEKGGLEDPADAISATSAKLASGGVLSGLGGCECASFWCLPPSTKGVASKPVFLCKYVDPLSTYGGGETLSKREKKRRGFKKCCLSPSGKLAFVSGDSAEYRIHMVALRETKSGWTAERITTKGGATPVIDLDCAVAPPCPPELSTGSASPPVLLLACATDTEVQFFVFMDAPGKRSKGWQLACGKSWRRLPGLKIEVEQLKKNAKGDFFKKYRFTRMCFGGNEGDGKREIITISTAPCGDSVVYCHELAWVRSTDGFRLGLRKKRRFHLTLPGRCGFSRGAVVCCADLSPDKQLLAYGTNDGTVGVTSLSGRRVACFPQALGDEEPVLSVAVRRDCRNIVLASSGTEGLRVVRAPIPGGSLLWTFTKFIFVVLLVLVILVVLVWNKVLDTRMLLGSEVDNHIYNMTLEAREWADAFAARVRTLFCDEGNCPWDGMQGWADAFTARARTLLCDESGNCPWDASPGPYR